MWDRECIHWIAHAGANVEGRYPATQDEWPWMEHWYLAGTRGQYFFANLLQTPMESMEARLLPSLFFCIIIISIIFNLFIIAILLNSTLHIFDIYTHHHHHHHP